MGQQLATQPRQNRRGIPIVNSWFTEPWLNQVKQWNWKWKIWNLIASRVSKWNVRKAANHFRTNYLKVSRKKTLITLLRLQSTTCDFHKTGGKIRGRIEAPLIQPPPSFEKESKDLIWHVSCKKAAGEQTKMSCKNPSITSAFATALQSCSKPHFNSSAFHEAEERTHIFDGPH